MTSGLFNQHADPDNKVFIAEYKTKLPREEEIRKKIEETLL